MGEGRIRLGIVGSGRIATRFAPELACVDGIEAVCVYNPHVQSAQAYAKACGIASVAESFEQLLEECDAVYVASPHETHFGYARASLEAGRHVLCEKPLALSGDEAAELYELAERSGCVLVEAVKTAFCPGYRKLVEVVRSGVIGEVRDVESCFTRLTPRGCRERDDVRFGGSLLELGSYAFLPIVQLLGCDFEDVRFESITDADGIDVFTKVSVRYPNALALAKVGLGVKSEGQLIVSGTEGYVLAQAPWWLTERFEVHREDPDVVDVYEAEYAGEGLRYEIAAFVDAIAGAGDSAAFLKPEESIAAAKMVERFLRQRNQA